MKDTLSTLLRCASRYTWPCGAGEERNGSQGKVLLNSFLLLGFIPAINVAWRFQAVRKNTLQVEKIYDPTSGESLQAYKWRKFTGLRVEKVYRLARRQIKC